MSEFSWWANTQDKRLSKEIMNKSWGERIYTQQALRMTNQMFKWKNLPDTIPERIMEGYLQTCGQIFFTKAQGNYYVFFGGAGSYPNVYYEPTEFIVSNPGLNFYETLKIDVDGVLIRNDSMSMGLLPMIERYAKQMVENDISILDAQQNMRIQSVLVATHDNAKKSAELYLENVKKGELGIIVGKALLDDGGLQTKPFATAGTSNGLSQLIEMHQYLKASLLGELGLNANFNMKRERINTAESELNQDALLPLVDDMLAMRKNACEKINAMYGLNIDVEKNSTWKDEQEATEESMEGAEEVLEEGASETVEETEEGASEGAEEGASDDPGEMIEEAIEKIVEEVIEGDSEQKEEGEENDGTEKTV